MSASASNDENDVFQPSQDIADIEDQVLCGSNFSWNKLECHIFLCSKYTNTPALGRYGSSTPSKRSMRQKKILKVSLFRARMSEKSSV